MSYDEEEALQGEFAGAQQMWRAAIKAHRYAPPDAGFSGRLQALSRAAYAESHVCMAAHKAGFTWPAAKAEGERPWELRSDVGRRGPENLWHDFDAAVATLKRAAADTDLEEVASAFRALAATADNLGDAIEAEDRASGLLPPAAADGTA
jgi:hypothetical protein